jgi:hypothetical protein
MLPTRVALVPYTTDRFPLDELGRVADVLQRQVNEHVGPVWSVHGIVKNFSSIDDVPTGYIPLVIVGESDLKGREHAFHYAPDGQPLGLVEHRQNWTQMASHELIEILCDPWGNRTVAGRSLADTDQTIVGGPCRDLGAVEYLVEVCDPCQRQPYPLDGVAVSDFVTPAYYGDPDQGRQGPYSHTGEVKKPLQILPGGYITWSVRLPRRQIWQAAANDAGELTICELASGTPVFTRTWVDQQSTSCAGQNAARTAAPPRGPRTPDRYYGKSLKTEVDSVLDAIATAPSMPSLAQVVGLVRKLATDNAFYTEFSTNAATRNKELNAINISGLQFPQDQVPSQDRYVTVLAALNNLQSSTAGPALDQPALSNDLLALAMHGTTI